MAKSTFEQAYKLAMYISTRWPSVSELSLADFNQLVLDIQEKLDE